MAAHHRFLADAEGWVEEDVQEINHYLHNSAERRVKTTCTWASLYTDSNRLFPCPEPRFHEFSAGAQRPSPLSVLCDEFPELFSVTIFFAPPTECHALMSVLYPQGWPGGLLIRHLPVKNIARLSATSRSWRHLMQDPNVWKLLCALSWPGCKRSQIATYGGSWRAMYITRPRPRMDGLYVLKWSTQRHGRNEGRGMKDAGKDYYKPAIITLMYKILLFQTGGRVLTMTTSIEHTPPDKLLRRVRRSEIKLSTKRLQEKVPQSKNCSVSVAGVVRGRYTLDANMVELAFVHVPEENLRMQPINTQYTMCLHSRSTASNDVLTTLRHTTGSDENGLVELDVPPRPFRFLPFETFASKMSEIEGWPDCYVGQPLDLTQ